MTQDELRTEFERWAKSKKLPITISEHFINAGAYSHQDTHVAWLSYQACNAKRQEEMAKHKEAMDFIYGSIGRDFGHLDPLDAAKAWMDAVLDKDESERDKALLRECAEAMQHVVMSSSASPSDAESVERFLISLTEAGYGNE